MLKVCERQVEFGWGQMIESVNREKLFSRTWKDLTVPWDLGREFMKGVWFYQSKKKNELKGWELKDHSNKKCTTKGPHRKKGILLFFCLVFLCCCCCCWCPTLCDPMAYSMPGFPVFHHFLELAQTLLSWWYHPTISSSVIPFSSCLQSFSAPGSFPLSQFFASGGQIIGASASASVLPVNIQDWFPLGLTGLISLQSKGFSRVFSDTTVQKHHFFNDQSSLCSNSHIHTWLLEKL